MLEVGRQLAAVEIAALQTADRGIGVIVPHHPDHRQIIFDRGAEHVGVHEEGAVAAHRHAGPVGRGKLGAQHAGDAEAHGAEAHAADQRIRAARLAEAEQPVVMHADVADQDRVVGQPSSNLKRRALRIDRLGVVGEAGRDELVPFLAIAVDLREPLLARVELLVDVLAAVEFGEHLAQEGAHVGHQPERDRIIAADLVRIDVDMNELGRRNGEGVAGNPRTRGAVVEARAERQQARRPAAWRGWRDSGRRARPCRAPADDACRSRQARSSTPPPESAGARRARAIPRPRRRSARLGRPK